jgi:hypothetical protein
MIIDRNDVVHKRTLKKRLAKAYRKMGLEGDNDKNIQGKHRHSDRRPDPAAKLLKKAQELKTQQEEKIIRVGADIKEIEKRRSAQEKWRKELHRIHTSRTNRGQPKLSNQIGTLLDKINRLK